MELNVHYKYDTFGRYYYLTTAGAELITGLDQLDKVWSNPERRLQSMGKIFKEIMCLTSSLESRPRYRRLDYIEYIQYKNENDELDDILYMLGEMAEWAYDVDGDRIAYEEGNPMDIIKLLPYTIRNRGRSTGLIFIGKQQYTVDEDEYRVGY